MPSKSLLVYFMQKPEEEFTETANETKLCCCVVVTKKTIQTGKVERTGTLLIIFQKTPKRLVVENIFFLIWSEM